jgi:hypothetical protein
VIVAVASVRVMQVAVDQIIGMVTVWHLLMTAIGAVRVAFRVRVAGMVGSASVGIGRIDRKPMLIRMRSMRGMKVSIVEIVGVAFVVDGDMTAGRTVDMRLSMPRMVRAGHGQSCNN